MVCREAGQGEIRSSVSESTFKQISRWRCLGGAGLEFESHLGQKYRKALEMERVNEATGWGGMAFGDLHRIKIRG